jgi:hypothetical protein
MRAVNMKKRSSTQEPKKSPEPTCDVLEDRRTSEGIRREYERLTREFTEAAIASLRKESEIL